MARGTNVALPGLRGRWYFSIGSAFAEENLVIENCARPPCITLASP